MPSWLTLKSCRNMVRYVGDTFPRGASLISQHISQRSLLPAFQFFCPPFYSRTFIDASLYFLAVLNKTRILHAPKESSMLSVCKSCMF